ncbi:MAG: hypothetical protein AB1644_10165 [Candidatus Zixiibacteriota bacterium]
MMDFSMDTGSSFSGQGLRGSVVYSAPGKTMIGRYLVALDNEIEAAPAYHDEDFCFHNAGTCPDCGSGLIRSGLCFSCPSCGFGTCGG